MTCDPCREGKHDDCIEKDFSYDHEGTDRRVCYCRCADAIYPDEPTDRAGDGE